LGKDIDDKTDIEEVQEMIAKKTPAKKQLQKNPAKKVAAKKNK
jgi:hypothetical protein